MTQDLIVQGSSALETLPASVTPDQYGEMALAEAQKAIDASLVAVASAKLVKVTTEEEYRAADLKMTDIKASMRGFEDKRDGLVRPFNTVVAKINARFKEAKDTYTSALSFYRTPMTAFQAKLAEDRRKADEAAAAERKRLQDSADDKRRKAEEALRLAQEQAEAATKPNAPLDAFDALLAEGEAQEAAARVEAAKSTFEQTIRDTSRIEVPVAFTPKVTGSGSKTYTEWKYEITDPAAVPMTFRPISEAMIAAEVMQMKGETKIPGVRIYSEVIVK